MSTMCVLLNKFRPVQGYIPGGPAGPSCPVPPLPTVHVRPHLVVQGEFAESGDVLGPLNEHQQLLLHGLAHVGNAGDLLCPDVSVDPRDRGGDLGGDEGKCWGWLGCSTRSEPCRGPSPDSAPVWKRGDGLWVPSWLGGSLRENGQKEGC